MLQRPQPGGGGSQGQQPSRRQAGAGLRAPGSGRATQWACGAQSGTGGKGICSLPAPPPPPRPPGLPQASSQESLVGVGVERWEIGWELILTEHLLKHTQNATRQGGTCPPYENWETGFAESWQALSECITLVCPPPPQKKREFNVVYKESSAEPED